MSAFKDLTGQRFGDWLVESYSAKTPEIMQYLAANV